MTIWCDLFKCVLTQKITDMMDSDMTKIPEVITTFVIITPPPHVKLVQYNRVPDA